MADDRDQAARNPMLAEIASGAHARLEEADVIACRAEADRLRQKLQVLAILNRPVSARDLLDVHLLAERRHAAEVRAMLRVQCIQAEAWRQFSTHVAEAGRMAEATTGLTDVVQELAHRVADAGAIPNGDEWKYGIGPDNDD